MSSSSGDLFAGFDRMRREVDELFGELFDHRLGGPRRAGFSPAVDVFYADDPPRAVVQAELAGVDPATVNVEVHGRELVLSGARRPPRAQGRVYQQIEIEHGPFRRVIPLGADVVAEEAGARYVDGFLEVTLPLRREEPKRRSVPIEVAE